MRISDWSSDVCSSDLGGKSRINHVADLFFDADVDLECNRITSEPTDLLGYLRDCGLTAYREEDMGALFGESQRGCAADSCSATRDDGSFILVTRHRSEEHTSELQSQMRISYAVFCLKNKITHLTRATIQQHRH